MLEIWNQLALICLWWPKLYCTSMSRKIRSVPLRPETANFLMQMWIDKIFTGWLVAKVAIFRLPGATSVHEAPCYTVTACLAQKWNELYLHETEYDEAIFTVLYGSPPLQEYKWFVESSYYGIIIRVTNYRDCEWNETDCGRNNRRALAWKNC